MMLRDELMGCTNVLWLTFNNYLVYHVTLHNAVYEGNQQKLSEKDLRLKCELFNDQVGVLQIEFRIVS